MTDQGFSAEEIDTTKPHPARMYDYYLGGWDNYEIDREYADQVMTLSPDTAPSARANRAFLRRAVRFVVRAGIRQIIDIGTGIPTSPNTHEVAREVVPDVRVAYVDNDPIVATHAGAKLTNTGNTGFLLADVRDPKAILEHPTIRELIDFDQPVALLLVALMHFIDESDDPAGIVAALTEALPRGSYLVLTHCTSDFHRDVTDAPDASVVYKSSTANLTPRTGSEVERFFAGFELADPGLVQPPLWRPDGPPLEGADVRRIAFYAGVGIKN